MSRVPLFEKYRPRTLDQILDQSHVVKVMREYVKRGDIPHLLFIGKAGTGKTTMAHVLANELGWQIIEYNASDDRGINVIREDIKTVAFTRGKKIILLDEADSLTVDAQQALRRIMEKSMRAGTRFILTGNYEWKIIDPIKSRCAIFRFSEIPEELMAKRLAEIAINEGVVLETDEQLREFKKAIMMIVRASRGDMRKALNMLETVLTSGGGITTDNVSRMLSIGVIGKAIMLAHNGDLSGAIELVENAVVNGADVGIMLEEAYNGIMGLRDQELVADSLMELARCEHALKMGGSPLIQFSALMAMVWYKSLRRG